MSKSANPLISSGVTTAGNLIGAGLNRLFGKDAAKEQFEYNKQLIAEQYKYNNPQRQMADYRAAGINPYAALGNNTSVSGSSVGQAPTPELSGLGSEAVDAFQSGYLLQSQKDKNIADAQAAVSQSKALAQSALESEANTNKLKSMTKYQDLYNDFFDQASSDMKESIRLANEVKIEQAAKLRSDTTLTSLQATAQDIKNKRLDELIDSQLAMNVAQIYELYTRGMLNKASASRAVEEALNAAEFRKGIVIDNDVKRRTADAIVSKAEWDSDTSMQKSLKTAADKRVSQKEDTYYWRRFIPFAGLFK